MVTLAALSLSACCPAAAPATTAFVGALGVGPAGEVWARTADGRRVVLDLAGSDMERAATAPATGSRVYLTGTWTDSGRLAVTSIRTVPAAGR